MIERSSFPYLASLVAMLAVLAFATWRAWLPFSAYPVFHRINSRKRLKSRAVMCALRNTILACTTGSIITDVFEKYNSAIALSNRRRSAFYSFYSPLRIKKLLNSVEILLSMHFLLDYVAVYFYRFTNSL